MADIHSNVIVLSLGCIIFEPNFNVRRFDVGKKNEKRNGMSQVRATVNGNFSSAQSLSSMPACIFVVHIFLERQSQPFPTCFARSDVQEHIEEVSMQ